MTTRTPRFAVVGLGLQGSGIARLSIQQGYDLAGAVDVGDKVGRPLSEVLGVGPDTPVFGSVDELLTAVTDLDFVVLTPAISLPEAVELTKPILAAGIDVITLHQDFLSPDPSWTPELDAVAKAGGATFLSTGAQDPWWIHVPSLVASSTLNITRIRVVSILSLEALSVGLSELIGVGKGPESFEETRAMMLHAPAVLGGALQEVARRFGATAGELTKTYELQTLDQPYEWGAGERTIPAGYAAGTQEVASFDTDLGIRFEGVFRVDPISLSEAADELHIDGDPDLHLRYSPFPGEGITNAALISRIPDVRAAAPGVIFAADLPPAKPHFPLH